MVSTHFFVEADHSGERATRISQIRVLIFVNKSPILWYSKQQNIVENIKFSSDFIYLKTATGFVESLWCKLWMFGIPVEGPTSMCCDNEAVYKNASTPELTLKNKNVIICYHNVRKAVAKGLSRISKEGTSTSLDDLFTKMLVHIRRENLLDKFM